MTTARDIMSEDVVIVSVDDTVDEVAGKMKSEGFGAAPVCGPEGELYGVITDRDIVVDVVAQGRDPRSTKVGEVVEEVEVVTIGADDGVDEAIETMKRHKVRRLPVIDGTEIVGVVSQADLAKAAPEERAGDLLEAISSAPDNN